MARELPGNTPLGQSINKNSSQSDFFGMERIPAPKIGRIIKAERPEGAAQYSFIVRIPDSTAPEGYINTSYLKLLTPLKDSSSAGDSPESLEARQAQVKVHYRANTLAGAELELIDDLYTLDLERVEKHNSLSHDGKSFAPPGTGVA